MESEIYLKKFMDVIVANSRGRKIVLWGVCSKAQRVESLLSHWGGGVVPSFYVDSDSRKVNGANVREISSLKHKSDEYFVVIPLAYHSEIEAFLLDSGYGKEDYCYLSHPPITVTGCKDYSDEYGNSIIGEIGGCEIIFCGYGSHVELGSGFFAEENARIQVFSSNSLLIGERVSLGSSCFMLLGDDAQCSIGGHSRLGHRNLVVCGQSKLSIADGFSAGEYCTFVAEPETELEFGVDCLLSTNIVVRSNDGHTIFDVRTGKNINSTSEICKARKVLIKDHVWIGHGVTILYNSVIESGSIIGASSLVKGRFPNNCILAGNPAKVIRRDVAWSGTSMVDDIASCGMDYVNFTRDA